MVELFAEEKGRMGFGTRAREGYANVKAAIQLHAMTDEVYRIMLYNSVHDMKSCNPAPRNDRRSLQDKVI